MRLRKPLDDRDLWSAVGHCPIEKAMGVVGTRPAMLLMREAYYGTGRFDDFVDRIGVAPATAAAHLRTLTDAGLLQRQPYQEPGERARDGYALTEAGLDLMPVLVALFEWGVRHAGGNDELEYGHAGCGSRVGVRVECAKGHEVGSEDVEVRVRPRRTAESSPGATR